MMPRPRARSAIRPSSCSAPPRPSQLREIFAFEFPTSSTGIDELDEAVPAAQRIVAAAAPWRERFPGPRHRASLRFAHRPVRTRRTDVLWSASWRPSSTFTCATLKSSRTTTRHCLAAMMLPGEDTMIAALSDRAGCGYELDDLVARSAGRSKRRTAALVRAAEVPRWSCGADQAPAAERGSEELYDCIRAAAHCCVAATENAASGSIRIQMGEIREALRSASRSRVACVRARGRGVHVGRRSSSRAFCLRSSR